MGGKDLQKSIMVQTNDARMGSFRLEVAGHVKKFVTISPTSVIRLNGKAGTPVIAEVRIIQEKQYPFTIKKIQAKKGEFIRWEIKEEKKAGQLEYLLRVENIKPDAGRYFDTLTISTDSRERPEFDLRVYGQINDPKDERGNAGNNKDARSSRQLPDTKS